MEKKRVFKNTAKYDQIIYNRALNPVLVKPGQTFTEDLTGAIDVNALVRQEQERRKTESDVEESKRVRKVLALVKIAKTLEDLAKLKETESNQEIIDAILAREKELLEKDKK